MSREVKWLQGTGFLGALANDTCDPNFDTCDWECRKEGAKAAAIGYAAGGFAAMLLAQQVAYNECLKSKCYGNYASCIAEVNYWELSAQMDAAQAKVEAQKQGNAKASQKVAASTAAYKKEIAKQPDAPPASSGSSSSSSSGGGTLLVVGAVAAAGIAYWFLK